MVKRVNFVYILPPSQKWKKKSWLMLLYKDQQDVSTGGGGVGKVCVSLSRFFLQPHVNLQLSPYLKWRERMGFIEWMLYFNNIDLTPPPTTTTHQSFWNLMAWV